jgi:predicted DNA repair protein MutK
VSGFLALLDDVAAIAKLAATQIDDIAAHAAKAGGKSAGIVIDDAAVTPKYVTGLPAAREIPIVAKIAAGSLISKLAILLPGSWPYELTTSIATAVTGEGASAAVSWLVMAFLDAVFGFLLGSILIPIVNVLPEK